MSFQRYLLIGLLSVPYSQVYAIDPFKTYKFVTENPASKLDVSDSRYATTGLCTSEGSGKLQPNQQIDLAKAIELAMCNSPDTRAAWNQVKIAAANVGISKAAFLPNVNLSAKQTKNKTKTSVKENDALSSDARQDNTTANVVLNMVLFDFGGRQAQVKANKSLLYAAQATQNQSLQEVFSRTAKDYYDAVAAYQSLAVLRGMEQNAKLMLAAATAKVNKGFAPITDQLQAQTAYDQVYFKRYKAESDYNIVLGALATDLGLRPDANLDISADAMGSANLPNTNFIKDVKKLLDNALQQYPSIQAARAEADAAKAQIAVAKSQGMPTLSLVSQASWDNQQVRVSLGQPYLNASTVSTFVGLQLDVPLFTGFDRTYKVRKATAEYDAANDKLAKTVNNVSTNIWTSYQQFKTSDEYLRNTVRACSTARLAVTAAEKRYKSGVGSIVELTSAQNTLMSAEQQQIQARKEWLVARVTLGASIGQLGMWATTTPN